MIRSANLSLKFSNQGKQETLKAFLAEYRRVCCEFISLLWDEKKIPALLPREATSQVNTWLSARAKQAIAK